VPQFVIPFLVKGSKSCVFTARLLTRVNLTNVQYEGLRIGGVGRRMNSKVKSVKRGVYRK
jgi:hypothetical protein